MRSLDVRDNEGRTPLDMAIENNTSAAIYLLNQGCLCGDKERGKLLCRASNDGKFYMVKELVDYHNVVPKGQHVYCFTKSITLHNHCPLWSHIKEL